MINSGVQVLSILTYHGRDLIHGLQELNNLGLVLRLHTGEEARASDSSLLLSEGQVVKLSARVGLSSCVLFLSEHSNTSADSFSSSLHNNNTNWLHLLCISSILSNILYKTVMIATGEQSLSIVLMLCHKKEMFELGGIARCTHLKKVEVR